MKRKVGTTLDADLYSKVREVARQQGRSVNAVIEDALARFVTSGASRPSVVEETRGTYKISDEMFRAVLDEDLYDVE